MAERQLFNGAHQKLTFLFPLQGFVGGRREPVLGCYELASRVGFRFIQAHRGHLANTTHPPPLSVLCAIDDDAVDPGAERSVSPETSELAVDLEKDLLSHVGRLVVAPEQAVGQVENHVLITLDELIEGTVVALETTLDERCLIPRPPPGSGGFAVEIEQILYG